MSRAATFTVLAALACAGCASSQHEPGMAGGLLPEIVESQPETAIARGAPPLVQGWATSLRTHDDTVVVYDEADAEHAGAYRLDTGDKIRIFVYAQPSLSRIYTIDQEGFISVPLIGETRARGLTTRGLADMIRSRLAQSYVRDPHVTVDISQNRPFFILGEVKAAGQYPYVPGMTVEAAIAIAGGDSERADERKVQITRRKNGVSEKLDAGRDALVRPGDTIHISERWF
ncbi:MAG TPA: polysaccharide biosynthesis/export family protein [Hyphomicrobiaceae bacterium]|nr:polysaccharide biosynthesis/export family protein [Hyphomicrobiaceae bacterium]